MIAKNNTVQLLLGGNLPAEICDGCFKVLRNLLDNHLKKERKKKLHLGSAKGWMH